ncbi:hypothetical protein LOD99_15914 [Oopsacas minuta]|uniref:Uncharacterized protein n=1 Tax=Oopsacas minuta TaxID=111878 RepID=A0AAV7K8P3_9METZ|nr:hypothetical protein LOD99_15914 [Oopsacas minuta]
MVNRVLSRFIFEDAKIYADLVLHGVTFQYLNTMLWETIDEWWPKRSPELHNNPIILIVTESWPQDKWNLLDLPFNSVSNQPTNYVEQQLCSYKPWETETIVGGRNAYFGACHK